MDANPQRRHQTLPFTHSEHLHSEGILCDVNISFKAAKVPSDGGKPANSSKKHVDVAKTPKLAAAFKTCLTEALSGFSKEELKNYTVQLLMNNCPVSDLNDFKCPPPKVNETEAPEQQRNNAGNKWEPAMQCASELTNSHKNRNGASGPRWNPSCCTGPPMDDLGTILRQSIRIKDEDDETFDRIMRLLDTLCELRPLVKCNKNSPRARQGKTTAMEGVQSGTRSPPVVQGTPFTYDAPSGNDTLDCHPTTQPLRETERPPENQLRNERVEPFGRTKSYPPRQLIVQQDEDARLPYNCQGVCQPYISREEGYPYTDLDEEYPSTISLNETLASSPEHSLENPFARDSFDTVILNTSPNRTPRWAPPTEPLPRISTPRQCMGGQPRPLVTPRMGLRNPYTRLNRTH